MKVTSTSREPESSTPTIHPQTSVAAPFCRRPPFFTGGFWGHILVMDLLPYAFIPVFSAAGVGDMAWVGLDMTRFGSSVGGRVLYR